MRTTKIDRKPNDTDTSNRTGIPSGVSRNRRMVALCGMSRKIARSRLRGFYIRSNVHRNPRAAKPITITIISNSRLFVYVLKTDHHNKKVALL